MHYVVVDLLASKATVQTDAYMYTCIFMYNLTQIFTCKSHIAHIHVCVGDKQSVAHASQTCTLINTCRWVWSYVHVHVHTCTLYPCMRDYWIDTSPLFWCVFPSLLWPCVHVTSSFLFCFPRFIPIPPQVLVQHDIAPSAIVSIHLLRRDVRTVKSSWWVEPALLVALSTTTALESALNARQLLP